jgi:hypothetical protein
MLPDPPQLGKGNSDMADKGRNEMPGKQPQAPRPPLSRPGAASDSDRAKKLPLGKRQSIDKKGVPGDRVEANFGKPTGVVGTVEQASEDEAVEAVVKWDRDGRIRLRQPWLKKI